MRRAGMGCILSGLLLVGCAAGPETRAEAPRQAGSPDGLELVLPDGALSAGVHTLEPGTSILDLASSPQATPDYRFRLGTGSELIELIRFGEFTALLRRSRWADGQRPAPAGFDQAAELFLLNEDLFARLKAGVESIDPPALARLGPADFEPAPPDARWAVLITLERRGETVLDLRRPGYRLAERCRRPVDALREVLDEEVAASRREPIRPRLLVLLLQTPGAEPLLFVRDEGGPALLGGGARRPAPAAMFPALWAYVLEQRLAFRDYRDRPLAPEELDTRLVIQIDGHTLLDARTRLADCSQIARIEGLEKLLHTDAHELVR